MLDDLIPVIAAVLTFIGADVLEIVSGEPADRLGSVQLTEPPPPPPTTVALPPNHDIWLAMAECESGGDWSIDTGNGFYGGLQFTLQSWRGVGESGYPHHASMLTQMWAAERLLDLQGWGAWPACARRLGLR